MWQKKCLHHWRNSLRNFPANLVIILQPLPKILQPLPKQIIVFRTITIQISEVCVRLSCTLKRSYREWLERDSKKGELSIVTRYENHFEGLSLTLFDGQISRNAILWNWGFMAMMREKHNIRKECYEWSFFSVLISLFFLNYTICDFFLAVSNIVLLFSGSSNKIFDLLSGLSIDLFSHICKTYNPLIGLADIFYMYVSPCAMLILLERVIATWKPAQYEHYRRWLYFWLCQPICVRILNL